MSIRDLSPKTIMNYNSDLMQWFIYMHDYQFNLSVLEATDEDIEEYYYWRKKQGNNVNRQKRVMSSISAFYKFLRKKKLIKESPVEFIERPKEGQSVVTQTFLTKEQVQYMREKLQECGDIQLYTYTMLSLTTMARVNAIAHLKWDQINFEDRTCEHVLEKEGKDVELSFSEEVKDLLLQLQEYRKQNEYRGLWMGVYNSICNKRQM
ncbi:MAG: tyrosine-type recombinase/integrase [Sellimonas intestinalis]